MNRIALFLFSIISLSFKVQANNKVVISMNMNECNTCYNALSYLDLIDSSIELVYIFPKAHHSDSADIQKLFEFPIRGKFIWSDELNKQYLINSFFTSLTYTNAEECNPLIYGVKEELNKDLVSYINTMNQSESIFTFEEEIFTPANRQYYFYEDKLFWINTLKNHLMMSDMKTGKVNLLTDLSDTLINEAYLNFFKDEIVAKERKDIAFSIAKEYKIRKYQTFESFDIYNNKIYLGVQYLDYEFRNNFEDTLQTSFKVIHILDFNANLLNTMPIRYYDEEMVNNLKRTSDNNIDSFFYINSANAFKVISDTTFLFETYASGNLLRSDFMAYFSASYNYDERKNEFELKEFLPFTLQERYKRIGYNLSTPRFSWKGDCFTIPFNDAVYFKNDDAFYSYSLGVFEDLPFMEDLFSDPYRGNEMVNKIGHMVYLLFRDDQTLYYYKANILNDETYKVNVSEMLKEKNHRGGMYPDPFDYEYLYYPISNNQLKRIQIF